MSPFEATAVAAASFSPPLICAEAWRSALSTSGDNCIRESVRFTTVRNGSGEVTSLEVAEIPSSSNFKEVAECYAERWIESATLRDRVEQTREPIELTFQAGECDD